MDFAEIKLEPDDMHDSMVDVAEEIENNSGGSESTQHVDRSGELLTGKFF